MMSGIPQSVLDELRARLAVSEVVGKRVRLKKAGREWKGLSPFNKERSPSFFVNDQKGFYHDFSSGRHGDIFTFMMETEGVTFPEAVERLAAIAGLAVPKMTPEAQAEAARRRRTLHEAIEPAKRDRINSNETRRAAAIWNEAIPIIGTPGEAYLASRGIALEDAPDQAGLRFNPNCPWERDTTPCVIARFTTVLSNEPKGIWRRPIGGGKPKTLGT